MTTGTPCSRRSADYRILLTGREVAAVAGSPTSYQVTGLSSATAYQFNVLAVTGTLRSPSSSAVFATTTPPPPPPLADAVFEWAGNGNGNETETAATDDYWHGVGATWSDQWSVNPTCGTKVCSTAVLDGSVDGVDFTSTLHRSGATWTGGGPSTSSATPAPTPASSPLATSASSSR